MADTWIKRSASRCSLLLLLAALAAWWLLRGSLPALDGELALPGLSAPVTVQRDALGVVTIDAANERDAMRALGYVHAQERYFEMDLMRRTAAGELAELFGPRAIDTDKQHRVHRMRARVTRRPRRHRRRPACRCCRPTPTASTPASPASRPGRGPTCCCATQPEPWQLADTRAGRLRDVLRPAGRGQRARAGAVADQAAPAAGAVHAAAPRRQQLGRADGGHVARRRGAAGRDRSSTCASCRQPAGAGRGATAGHRPELGSNNFAVAGALTARRPRDRRQRHAPDPARAQHLVPRAVALRRPARAAGPGRRRRLHPARPAGDGGRQQRPRRLGLHQQLRRLAGLAARATAAPRAPPTPRRARPCTGTRSERIDVAGAAAGRLSRSRRPRGARSCIATGRRQQRWPCAGPRTCRARFNLGSGGFRARVPSLDAARRRSPTRVGDPGSRTWCSRDRHGRIAWRLLGPMPRRGGGCVDRRAWSKRDRRCPRTRPAIPGRCETDGAPTPRSTRRPGAPWTANSRVVDGVALQRIGDGGYVARLARASRSAMRCSPTQRFGERDLLAIQLDDRTAVPAALVAVAARQRARGHDHRRCSELRRRRQQLAGARHARLGQLPARPRVAPGRCTSASPTA